MLLHIAEQEVEGTEGKKTKFVSVIDWITVEGMFEMRILSCCTFKINLLLKFKEIR